MNSFIKNLGLFNGILTKLILKFNLANKIKLPHLKCAFSFRAGTIDKYTIEEVFVKKNYDFTFPPNWQQPQIIIDGGANIGLTSVFFTHKYPLAKIISIEPERENYNYLVKNTKAYPNIIAKNAALWPVSVEVSIVDNGYGLRGFMIEDNNPAPFNKARQIQATSITDIMHEYKIDTIDILKIDIEGSEKDLFEKNYDVWLPKTKCIIIEIHDNMRKGASKSVFQAINKYNFSCAINGEDLLFLNENMK